MRLHLALGLAAGLVLGLTAAGTGSPALLPIADGIAPVGQASVSFLTMMAVPLLVAAVIFAGVGSMSDLRTLGRVAAATLALFIVTSVVGVLVGTATLHTLLPLASDAARSAIASKPVELPPLPDPMDFVLRLGPANPFAAAADGALLPLGVPSDG